MAEARIDSPSQLREKYHVALTELKKSLAELKDEKLDNINDILQAAEYAKDSLNKKGYTKLYSPTNMSLETNGDLRVLRETRIRLKESQGQAKGSFEEKANPTLERGIGAVDRAIDCAEKLAHLYDAADKHSKTLMGKLKGTTIGIEAPASGPQAMKRSRFDFFRKNTTKKIITPATEEECDLFRLGVRVFVMSNYAHLKPAKTSHSIDIDNVPRYVAKRIKKIYDEVASEKESKTERSKNEIIKTHAEEALRSKNLLGKDEDVSSIDVKALAEKAVWYGVYGAICKSKTVDELQTNLDIVRVRIEEIVKQELIGKDEKQKEAKAESTAKMYEVEAKKSADDKAKSYFEILPDFKKWQDGDFEKVADEIVKFKSNFTKATSPDDKLDVITKHINQLTELKNLGDRYRGAKELVTLCSSTLATADSLKSYVQDWKNAINETNQLKAGKQPLSAETKGNRVV